MKAVFLLFFLTCAVHAQSAYKISVGAFVAANALDGHSSWGKYEANPVLGRGTFGARQTAVKTGIVAGVLLAEWLVVRHHPERKRWLKWINYGAAAGITVVAAHNYMQPRSSVAHLSR